jgi:hypothetical protein
MKTIFMLGISRWNDVMPKNAVATYKGRSDYGDQKSLTKDGNKKTENG